MPIIFSNILIKQRKTFRNRKSYDYTSIDLPRFKCWLGAISVYDCLHNWGHPTTQYGQSEICSHTSRLVGTNVRGLLLLANAKLV